MAQPAVTTYTVGAGLPINGGRWPGGRLGGGVTLDATAAGSMTINDSVLGGGAELAAAQASGSLITPLAAFTVAADGIWTWYTDPRARQVGDYLYTMAVDSAGTCKVHRTDLGTQGSTSFALSSTGLEVDDHNNGSINVLANGKLLAFYGKHNDDFFRYRVSTAAADISAWSAEQARGTGQGPYSYPNAFRFSNSGSRIWLTYRQGGGGGASVSLSVRTCDDIETFPATTWSSESDVFSNPGVTPYWKLAHDGANRLHVAITDRHPVQGQSGLYHFYLEVDGGGTLRAYKSDGTEVTSSMPLDHTEVTQIYDGTSTRCWVSDVTIDTNGRPRVLYMRYPGNDGSAIEYWHARWTGSAWVSHKITDDGAGLYSPEVYYHGGLSFDGADPSRIYLSAPISGVRQIQEWATSDSGATWAQARVLTTGGTAGSPLKARPFGVPGTDGRVRVVWWEGTYTTFTNYSTAVKAAG